MKRVRALWRLGRVVVHLGYGAGVVAAVFPCVGPARRSYLKRRWSRQLLSMLGLQLAAGWSSGRLSGLVIANHISWLDVFVINAMQPVAFVAKDEVRDWPVIGWLSARTDTLFMARDNRRAAHAMGQRVAAELAAGATVAVFPEGTTTEGESVLPFRGALLQGAIDAGVEVQPLVLRYVGADGKRSTAAAYCGETSLLESLWRIANASSLTAACHRLPSVDAAGSHRRALAQACTAEVAAALALAEQNQAPGGEDIDERDQDGGAADVLGPLGEPVVL
ncbi:MAG TPA: lysophospholipid acyltransferase family protein [Rhodocyclaceae bacterium]